MASAIKCDNKFDRGQEVYASTPQQLADWMNRMAEGVGTGVRHWYDENDKQIHFQRLGDGGKVVEEGIL